MKSTIGAGSTVSFLSRISKLTLAVFASVAVSSPAKADVFATHGLTIAHALVGGSVVLEGNGSLDTGLEFHEFQPGGGGPGSLTTGSARAIADIQADRFLRAYSGNTSGPSGNQVYAVAVAAWRDVISVQGTPPSELRLNFSLDGQLSEYLLPPNGYGGWGRFTLGWAAGLHDVDLLFDVTHVSGTGFHNLYTDASVGTDIGLPFTTVETVIGVQGDWDSTSVSGGVFSGTFHIDVPYSAEQNGYVWGLGLQSFTTALGGGGEADALHTLTLDAVTLLDGTPVSVSFESGLSSVPEPSAFLLLLLSLLGLSGIKRSSRE